MTEDFDKLDCSQEEGQASLLGTGNAWLIGSRDGMMQKGRCPLPRGCSGKGLWWGTTSCPHYRRRSKGTVLEKSPKRLGLGALSLGPGERENEQREREMGWAISLLYREASF